MKVLKYRLPKVINELLREGTVEDVLNHMQRDLREVGVEDFAILRVTHAGLPLEKWVLGMNFPRGKFEKHVYKGALQDSPVYRHSRQVIDPFFWYDAPHEPRDDERYKRAREDGVPEALVVPVPGPRGAIGIGWFGSATNSRAELHKYRHAIQVVCIAGFHRLEELVAPEPSQVRLSKKAQEVLVGVAEGWSSAQIGKRLHLSARTVEWHITQAMKRLDAKNRVQAVVLAMQKGALTLQLMLALLTDF